MSNEALISGHELDAAEATESSAAVDPWQCVSPIDLEAAARSFASARSICIDGFLGEGFAREIAASYPSYEDAHPQGRSFSAVNESLKVQICDKALFPAPVARLDAALASPAFVDAVSTISGIPKLLADEELLGGGMHLMNVGGRLDVHVDFNYVEAHALHRRLNILVFLNEQWEADWGGLLELWDPDVSKCIASFEPKLNRCVLFETSEISYHGVTPLTGPAGTVRRSFAGYYYTREAPASWTGKKHPTLFRARPSERFRGLALMPLERVARSLRRRFRAMRRRTRE